jgi:hypothetical protein
MLPVQRHPAGRRIHSVDEFVLLSTLPQESGLDCIAHRIRAPLPAADIGKSLVRTDSEITVLVCRVAVSTLNHNLYQFFTADDVVRRIKLSIIVEVCCGISGV